MKEKIKPIQGFEGYFVSTMGRIYSNLGKGNRRNGNTVELYEVAPRPGKNGYMRVYMREDATGKRKDRYIHRLVALHFLPKSDPSHNIVNHIDSNRGNNVMDNLEWTNTRGNLEHALDVGFMKRNALNGRFERK